MRRSFRSRLDQRRCRCDIGTVTRRVCLHPASLHQYVVRKELFLLLLLSICFSHFLSFFFFVRVCRKKELNDATSFFLSLSRFLRYEVYFRGNSVRERGHGNTGGARGSVVIRAERQPAVAARIAPCLLAPPKLTAKTNIPRPNSHLCCSPSSARLAFQSFGKI